MLQFRKKEKKREEKKGEGKKRTATLQTKTWGELGVVLEEQKKARLQAGVFCIGDTQEGGSKPVIAVKLGKGIRSHFLMHELCYGWSLPSEG